MSEEKLSILVIDDDLTLANTIKLILHNEGYYTEVAGDSTTALKLIKQKFFDVLLVDYNLPDMHGLELVKQAQEISSKTVPILITGVSSMDLAFEGMRLGVHDYLVKPINYDELKKIIKGIIEERRKIEQGKKELQETAGIDSTEVKEERVTQDKMPVMEDKKKEPVIPAKPFDAVAPPGSKKIKKIAVFFVISAVVLFVAIDTLFLRFTGLGQNLHNKIWPSDIIPETLPPDAEEDKALKPAVPVELMVKIESEPEGATVYVDGKRMGNKTPMSVNLTAGLHTVMLEKEGFPSLGNVERDGTYGQCNLDLSKKNQDRMDKRYWDVQIAEEEDGGIRLRGIFWNEIIIESQPSGAQFFIDGELLGETPFNVRVTVGEHKLEIKKSGFADWDKTISVPDKEKIVAGLAKIVKFIAYDAGNPGKDIGAVVWVNRKKIEGKTTPFRHSFKQAKYRILFVKSPGFENWTKNIKIENQANIIARMKQKKISVKIKVAETESHLPVDSALILLNGKEKGKTSEDGVLSLDVKIGDCLIEISKDNYSDKSVKKYVSEKTNEIEIYLEAEEVQPEQQKKQAEKSTPPEAQAQTTCTLIIDTRPNFPGAGIYFDGKFKGETMRRITGVALGKHKIIIDHPYIGRVASEIVVDKPGGKIILNINSTGEVEIK